MTIRWRYQCGKKKILCVQALHVLCTIEWKSQQINNNLEKIKPIISINSSYLVRFGVEMETDLGECRWCRSMKTWGEGGKVKPTWLPGPCPQVQSTSLPTPACPGNLPSYPQEASVSLPHHTPACYTLFHSFLLSQGVALPLEASPHPDGNGYQRLCAHTSFFPRSLPLQWTQMFTTEWGFSDLVWEDVRLVLFSTAGPQKYVSIAPLWGSRAHLLPQSSKNKLEC